MQTLKPFASGAAGRLRLSLGDTNPAVASALAAAFAEVAAVEVVQGNLLDLSCDAVVSPANSFGDMSGGIDKAIDDFHKGEAQRRLRHAIAEHFLGELPVGMALVVELAAARFPFVIAAPTMRIPGSLNAYLAMRAALIAVLRHNVAALRKIRTVAIPGLGTGVGGLYPAEAAEQMRAAHASVIEEKWRDVRNPVQAPFALRGMRLGGQKR
jgi:O-acetyl-ADP-ribose deacetylase (regulator of RNase III)